MKAAGWGTWWNQYGSVPLDQCVARARGLDFVVVKHGYWRAFDAFRAAGLRVGVERYVYPTQPAAEAQMLAEGIRRGAEFAVINAEVEWEAQSADPMRALITDFRREAGGAVEIYASVDTRGGRTRLPYQLVLGREITAWMPMIYPGAFQQTPAGAFTACLAAGQDFQGKPVLPTFQTYDSVGSSVVSAQMEEIKRRGLPGGQAYTVAHATPDEWGAFRRQISEQEDPDMAWLDEKEIGFDGRPLRYQVLVGGPPGYPVAVRELTRREWLRLKALGLVIDESTRIGNVLDSLHQQWIEKHVANAGAHEQ